MTPFKLFIMDPLVTSAAIGAGSNLVSGLANFALIPSQQHYQRKMMRYQSELQKDLMAQQNAYNLAILGKQYDQNVSLWNLQNEYNEPINQRKRLESAGFNPYSMLGQGGSIGLSSSQPAAPSSSGVGLPSVNVPTAPNMDTSFIGNSIQSYFNMMQQGQVIREQKAKSDMAEIDSRFREMQNVQDLSERLASIREKLSNVHLNDEKRQELEWENAITEATLQYTINIIRASAEQKAKEMKLLDAQYAKIYDDMATNAVQRLAIKAGIQVSAAQAYQLATSAELNKAATKTEVLKALGQVLGNAGAAKLLEALPSDIEYNQGWFHRYVSGLFGGAGSAVLGAFTKGMFK